MTAKATDLLYEVDDDAVAHITFNRPEVRNAVSLAMVDALSEHCRRLASDRSARTLVLTGAGEKAFASGADLREQAALEGEAAWRRFLSRWADACEALETLPIPTIAAVRGVCSGGGATLANCCDFRVAAPGARYGFTNARISGGGFSRGNVIRLVALVGYSTATQMLLSGRLFSAEEARAAGAFTEVVGTEAALGARVDELALELAGNAPITLRTAKSTLLALRIPIPPDNLDPALEAYLSEDFKEGSAAFRAKRRAAWRGV
jgi:enoyl-CoA hydratase/carnithine racemase